MPETQTPIGFHKDGSFRFHVPLDLKKGDDGKTWIEGVASVEEPDLAGETVILAGMDLSYLLNRGYFNDNHAKTTDGKVGVPTEAAVTPDGLKVKGFLFDTPRAQGIIDLATALQKSGSNRRLGFSVEGKTLQRDGKIVKRSWIKDIAITAEPVNPHTYLDVVKSISAIIEQNGYVDDDDGNGGDVEEQIPEPPVLSYWGRMEALISRCISNFFGRADGLGAADADSMTKTLEAGDQTAYETGGGALRKEDLEKDLVNLDIPESEDSELTEEDAVQMLIDRGYSEDVARKAANLLFSPNFRIFLVNTNQ